MGTFTLDQLTTKKASTCHHKVVKPGRSLLRRLHITVTAIQVKELDNLY